MHGIGFCISNSSYKWFFSTQHYVPLSKVKHVELVHSDPAAYITYVNISKQFATKVDLKKNHQIRFEGEIQIDAVSGLKPEEKILCVFKRDGGIA